MSLVEIVWATDRLALYNSLNRENRDDTHAVRHMLWFLTSGKLKAGNVYVDQWPSFSHVCCLHPTKLYESKEDRDFVVVCSSNLQEFRPFLAAVAKERRWHHRDGVILAYVEQHLADIAVDFLCPSPAHGTCWISQPLRHYTAYERQNLEAYHTMFEKFVSKAPSGFKVTTLRPDEATLVADNWPYNIPEKLELFRWLIANFPSVCTRDSQDRPIAWAISYSFGASGGAFVVPEYRGKGLHEVQVTRLIGDLMRTNPGQRFFWIVDDNIASLRQAQRSLLDMRRTDLMMKWVAYTTPREKVKALL